MTKFQKVQKLTSIIPFYSTFFIVIVTLLKLKKEKASVKIWTYFILIFFLSGTVVYLLNAFIMTGQHVILNIIASGIILAIANNEFVNLQVKSEQGITKQRTTGSKRIILIGIICLCLCAVVMGCALVIYLFLFPGIKIEDTNGKENINLNTITLEEIINIEDEYRAMNSAGTKTSGSRTKVVGSLKEVDYDYCSFTSSDVSGIATIQATRTNCKKIVLEIESQLNSGNLEIVIIIDDEYYKHVAVNQAQTVELDDISEKTVVVRIGAESANTHVVVKRSMGG